MNVEVEINGRLRVVSIQPVGDAGPMGGTFRVHVQTPQDQNARPVVHEVDVRATDLGFSVLNVRDGRSVDAALTPGRAGEWLVQLPHVGVTALVDGRRWRRGAVEAGGGSGEQRISAPMPGRVVRVLVKPGDRVEARQGLVVIEAMKMENELVASHAGTVADVAVADGMSVEAGRLLVRIDS